MTENVDAKLDGTESGASVENEAPNVGVEEAAEAADGRVPESATVDLEVIEATVEDSDVDGDNAIPEDAGEAGQFSAAEDGNGQPAVAIAELGDTSVEAEFEMDAVAVETATVDAAGDADSALLEDSKADAEEEDGGGDDDDGEAKRVVRMLAVGQQIEGVVRRITEFGAFVDIGVGRDGLIHISELSTRRVAKVSDVLSEKQEIQPWIKKLDRKRNRISLTLIDPEMKTIRDLEAGAVVQGTVTRILPYGAFVDLGIGRDALLHVREMSTGFVEKPDDVVQVGETIEARIIEVSRRRGRVDLSLKGLREESEPEEAVVEEIVAEEDLEEVDQFEDVEVLSPMELAFKKAVEAEGAEVQVDKRRGKRDRRRNSWSIQDEIIARTLDTGRK